MEIPFRKYSDNMMYRGLINIYYVLRLKLNN